MNYSFVRGFGARGKSNEVHAGFPKVVTWARRQLLVKMDFFVWYYMLFVFYSGVYCCHMQDKLICFYLPRDAMLPRYMLWLCVRLCLCLSVTNRCSTKTAQHRIIQTTLHDSP